MQTTGDRIKGLIVEAGLTQAGFGERVGIEASKLSKSLSGVRRFTSLELAVIADEMNVTVDWLLSGQESLMATAARAAEGSSAENALTLAQEYVTMRADLIELGYRQEWQLPKVSRWASRWIQQGTDLAAAALERLEQVGWRPGGDLADAIQEAFGIDVAVAELGEGFDGLAVATETAKLILVDASAVASRQRFTMVHELGHLLASDDQQVHKDADIYSAASKKGESEVRANSFAAALLMPEVRLRAWASSNVEAGSVGEADFCALATDLKVSPSALGYRLANLGLIDNGTREQLGSLTGKRAAVIAGKVDAFVRASAESMRPKGPASLLRDAFTAFQEGEATIRPYARLLGVDPKELRKQLAHVEEVED